MPVVIPEQTYGDVQSLAQSAAAGARRRRLIGLRGGLHPLGAESAPADLAEGGDPLVVPASTDDMVRLVRRRFVDAAQANEAFRSAAIESYKFVGNEQWDARDLRQYRRRRRPALTINKILSQVLWLHGVHRQQRTENTFLPADDDDVRVADLIAALYKYYGRMCGEDVIDDEVFSDKTVAGLGWWKVIVDFDTDPLGEPAWERCHPLTVFPDPHWLDNGWKKAGWVIHCRWYDRDEAMDEWPEHADEIARKFGEWANDAGGASVQEPLVTGESVGDSQAAQRLLWDKATQRVRVLEHWQLRRKRVTVALNTETGDVEVDPARVTELRRRVQVAPQYAGMVTFLERPVRMCTVQRVLDTVLLDDGPSPFDAPELPLFPDRGHYFWGKPFGLVEPLKDPQRERNKRRSMITETTIKMPNAGFMNKREGGATYDDLVNYAKGSGAVIQYETTMPVRIDPPQLPQTLVFLERQADQEIPEISGINRDLTGQTTQRTVSGRAIEARQRGGLTTQEPLLETSQQSKERAMLFFVRAIQQYTPIGRALKILGSLARRPQNQQLGALMQQAGPIEIQELLGRAMLARYDIVPNTDKPFEPTLKVLRWETLKDLAKTFPGWIPPQVLVNAAKAAGLISDEDAVLTLQWVQQQIAQQAAQGTLPPAGDQAPPGPPPG